MQSTVTAILDGPRVPKVGDMVWFQIGGSNVYKGRICAWNEQRQMGIVIDLGNAFRISTENIIAWDPPAPVKPGKFRDRMWEWVWWAVWLCLGVMLGIFIKK